MKKDACVRLAAAILTLINVILNMLGCNPLPFSENGFYEVVSAAAAAVMLVYSAWKNNSVTEAAIISDKFMKLIKDGKLAVSDARELISSIGEDNASEEKAKTAEK